MRNRQMWEAFCNGCPFHEFAALSKGKAYPPRCPDCGRGVTVQFYTKTVR